MKLVHYRYPIGITFRPKNFPYNADVIAVWANEIIRMGFIVQIEISVYNADVLPVCANKIGAIQTSNRHGPLQISNRYQALRTLNY